MVTGIFLSIFVIFCMMYIDVYAKIWYTLLIYIQKGRAHVSQDYYD
jgi:hypothetical protein